MDRIVNNVKDLTTSDIFIRYGSNVVYNGFKIVTELSVSVLDHVLEIEIPYASSDENTSLLSFNLSSSLLCVKDKKALTKCILDSNNAINNDNGLNIVNVIVTIFSSDVVITLYIVDVIENNNSELLVEVLEIAEEALCKIEEFVDKFTWMQINKISEYSEDGKKDIQDFLNNEIIIKG